MKVSFNMQGLLKKFLSNNKLGARMTVDPAAQLRAGVSILDPLLTRHGFVFGPINSGKGSGATFAHGDYVRAERRLELHYRWGLGLASYHLGDAVLDHLTYMRLLNVYRECSFASNELASDLQGFHRLLFDLTNFGSDFLEGDCTQFRRLAVVFKNNPTMFSGFQALSTYQGSS